MICFKDIIIFNKIIYLNYIYDKENILNNTIKNNFILIKFKLTQLKK